MDTVKSENSNETVYRGICLEIADVLAEKLNFT